MKNIKSFKQYEYWTSTSIGEDVSDELPFGQELKDIFGEKLSIGKTTHDPVHYYIYPYSTNFTNIGFKFIDNKILLFQVKGDNLDRKFLTSLGLSPSHNNNYISDGNYKGIEINLDTLKKVISSVIGGHNSYSRSVSDFYTNRKSGSGTVD